MALSTQASVNIMRYATNRPSVLTPAMNAFQGPHDFGYNRSFLGGLGQLELPAWAPWLGIAAFAYLGMRKTIPVWAAAVGALGTWYYFVGSTTSAMITGTAIMVLPDGTSSTLPANSTALVTTMSGSQSLVNQGVTYPVSSTIQNSDGSTSYYVDNPAGTATTAAASS